ILDLTARGPLRGDERRAIAIVMGPVWEANHVWLIFALTVSATAFPPAFAALCEALYLPFSLALVAIVLRGAAFAFRSYGQGAPGFARAPGVVFGLMSLLAPLSLGASAGAVASGRLRVSATGQLLAAPGASFATSLCLVAAGMAAVACAY